MTFRKAQKKKADSHDSAYNLAMRLAAENELQELEATDDDNLETL
jgi:hypothetical protein